MIRPRWLSGRATIDEVLGDPAPPDGYCARSLRTELDLRGVERVLRDVEQIVRVVAVGVQIARRSAAGAADVIVRRPRNRVHQRDVRAPEFRFQLKVRLSMALILCGWSNRLMPVNAFSWRPIRVRPNCALESGRAGGKVSQRRARASTCRPPWPPSCWTRGGGSCAVRLYA